jgi:hypothetical protein
MQVLLQGFPENGGIMFHLNVGTCLQVHTALLSTGPTPIITVTPTEGVLEKIEIMPQYRGLLHARAYGLRPRENPR